MQMLYMDIRTKAHSQCEFQKLGYILKVKSCLGRSKMCLVIGICGMLLGMVFVATCLRRV